MGKQPYIQFYLGDYIKDTRILPLNVKGGWVDLILAMWENDPKGELVGNMDDYARIMNCSNTEAILVIQILKQKKIFDYENLDDGFFKIISRKQKKMEKLSKMRKNVGKNGGNPVLLNQKVNQKINQKVNQNTEYENEYIFKDRKEGMEGKEGFNQMPVLADFNGLPQQYIDSSKELVYRLNNKLEIDDKTVISLWEIFKIQNLTGENWYPNKGKVYSHFLNCIKKEKFINNATGTKKVDATTKFNAGATELLNRLKGKSSPK